MLGKTIVPFTLDDYYRKVSDGLSALGTTIFVDTNILAYPYRLFPDARRELLNWFREIGAQSRLCVPAWAANEYFARASKANLREFLPKLDSRVSLGRLDADLQVARLALDDAAISPGAANRDALIRDLDAAIEALRPLLGALNVDHRQVDAIHNEIEETFAVHVLCTDIARLCADTAITAPHRFLHRIPPGFEDAGKKVNPFGDLALWNEIIEHVQSLATRPQRVVLITNDEKCDWSYAPRLRRRLDRHGQLRQEPNESPEIRLTVPHLEQELRARLKEPAIAFEVISIRHVVGSLSRADPARFRRLSVALQLQVAQESPALVTENPLGSPDLDPLDDDIVQVPFQLNSVNAPSATNATVPSVDDRQEVDQGANTTSNDRDDPIVVGAAATADSDYSGDATSQIGKVIEALRSCNWYSQNPAIGRIAQLANEQFSADAWFVLGRNVYQAACGSAYEAIGYIQRLPSHLGTLPRVVARTLLAGMLFEVYFNRLGDSRNENFKVDYLDDVMRAAHMPMYEPALRFVLEQLSAKRAEIMRPPNDLRQISVVASADRRNSDGSRPYWELRELRLDGIAAIKAGKNEVEALQTDELPMVLGRKYGVPPSLFRFSFEPEQIRGSIVYMREDCVLRSVAEMMSSEDQSGG